MALAARRAVIPSGPKKVRKPGGKPMVAFRAPDDVLDYLEQAPDRTELILKMVRVGRDCSLEMGNEWWEIERRANVEKKSIGTVLGELALEALSHEKKRK